MTRAEYLATLEAEHPGAYGRINDLMRAYDHANGLNPAEPPAQDPAPAAPVSNEEPET